MAKKKKRAENPGLIAQLKNAIRDSGKSLYELSKDSGVAIPQLSLFMRGKRSLTLPTVEKLCRTLRLGLAKLEEEVKPKAKKGGV